MTVTTVNKRERVGFMDALARWATTPGITWAEAQINRPSPAEAVAAMSDHTSWMSAEVARVAAEHDPEAIYDAQAELVDVIKMHDELASELVPDSKTKRRVRRIIGGALRVTRGVRLLARRVGKFALGVTVSSAMISTALEGAHFLARKAGWSWARRSAAVPLAKSAWAYLTKISAIQAGWFAKFPALALKIAVWGPYAMVGVGALVLAYILWRNWPTVVGAAVGTWKGLGLVVALYVFGARMVHGVLGVLVEQLVKALNAGIQIGLWAANWAVDRTFGFTDLSLRQSYNELRVKPQDVVEEVREVATLTAVESRPSQDPKGAPTPKRPKRNTHPARRNRPAAAGA